MSENYLVINGRRTELTEEQLRQLGIEPEKKRKNPFDRGHDYFSISAFGGINEYTHADGGIDSVLFDICNYFNDEAFAKQVELHQLLYRKLLKFAYDNECEDTAEWDGDHEHWSIRYNSYRNEFRLYYQDGYKAHEVYFSSEEGAKRAIEEVVKPFMREHPEFVW